MRRMPFMLIYLFLVLMGNRLVVTVGSYRLRMWFFTFDWILLTVSRIWNASFLQRVISFPVLSAFLFYADYRHSISASNFKLLNLLRSKKSVNIILDEMWSLSLSICEHNFGRMCPMCFGRNNATIITIFSGLNNSNCEVDIF